MRLAHTVGESVVRHRLWEAGDRVAVAVSGGVDSVVLLDVLVRTAGWHGAVLSVVTVDHGTRADTAAEAAFVEALAQEHGLPCLRVDLALGPASQDACRRARYAAFHALDVDRVALAHHQDDQAETVLINLLRGTGPAGLEGMTRRRGRYVRPLLDVSRHAIAAYAEERGLAWREDPSNASERYLRSRVRHELLPLLEDLRPGATVAVARSATLAAEQGAVLDALVPDDPWSRAWIAEGPEPVVRRFLLGSGLANTHVDALLDAARRGTGTVTLPDATLTVRGDRVVRRPGGPPT